MTMHRAGSTPTRAAAGEEAFRVGLSLRGVFLGDQRLKPGDESQILENHVEVGLRGGGDDRAGDVVLLQECE